VGDKLPSISDIIRLERIPREGSFEISPYKRRKPATGNNAKMNWRKERKPAETKKGRKTGKDPDLNEGRKRERKAEAV